MKWAAETGRGRVGEENGKEDAKKVGGGNEKRWENVRFHENRL